MVNNIEMLVELKSDKTMAEITQLTHKQKSR